MLTIIPEIYFLLINLERLRQLKSKRLYVLRDDAICKQTKLVTKYKIRNSIV